MSQGQVDKTASNFVELLCCTTRKVVVRQRIVELTIVSLYIIVTTFLDTRNNLPRIIIVVKGIR
jgi:hypothetical protein